MASAWTETRTKTDPKSGKATKSYLARWREPGEVSPKSKSFRRKSDALAFANARKVQLQKGTYVTEEKRTVTVADYLRLLINAHAGLRPGTRVNMLNRIVVLLDGRAGEGQCPAPADRCQCGVLRKRVPNRTVAYS